MSIEENIVVRTDEWLRYYGLMYIVTKSDIDSSNFPEYYMCVCPVSRVIFLVRKSRLLAFNNLSAIASEYNKPIQEIEDILQLIAI